MSKCLNLIVGDKVRVVDSGGRYSTYVELYERMATSVKLPPFVSINSPNRIVEVQESVGKLLCIAPHLKNETKLVGAVEIENQCILINLDCLTLVERPRVEENLEDIETLIKSIRGCIVTLNNKVAELELAHNRNTLIYHKK